jgi:hypothetical protein
MLLPSIAGVGMLNAQVGVAATREPFKGKIGRTVKGSTPDFPKGVEAPGGAHRCASLGRRLYGHRAEPRKDFRND